MTHATATVLISLAATTASAQLIDFETVPSAFDDMKITNQYKLSHGIVFGIDNDRDLRADAGAAPRLERTGPGPSASDGFSSSWHNGMFDLERTDRPQRLDDWFLRSTATGIPDSLLIEYTNATTFAASGQIWDIDGNGSTHREFWSVTAFDSNGSQLAQIFSPVGLTSNASNIYESGAWTWTFNLSTSGPAISKIRIDFIGNYSSNSLVGLAFDNFYAYSVPAPGGAAALLSCGLLTARRRRG